MNDTRMKMSPDRSNIRRSKNLKNTQSPQKDIIS